MVPVKTMKEYEMAQEVTVLFSETVQRLVILCIAACMDILSSSNHGMGFKAIINMRVCVINSGSKSFVQVQVISLIMEKSSLCTVSL